MTGTNSVEKWYIFIKIIKIVLRVLLILRYYKMQYQMSELIYEKKNDYYHQLARELIDLTTSCKTYRSILKTFYNDTKYH